MLAIFRLVIRQAVLLVGFGIALGVAAALGVSRLLASLLVGVSSYDPITFVSVSAVADGGGAARLLHSGPSRGARGAHVRPPRPMRRRGSLMELDGRFGRSSRPIGEKQRAT